MVNMTQHNVHLQCSQEMKEHKDKIYKYRDSLIASRSCLWHSEGDEPVNVLSATSSGDISNCTTNTPPPPHLNHFMALFLGPPGCVGARRELLDFMVQGKINRGRHTDHPAGRHSIRTNQCPAPPSPKSTTNTHWQNNESALVLS